MASKYFSMISNKHFKLTFYANKHDHDPAKLKLNKFDISMFRMFCLCLEAWDYCSDEQRNESLRSMIIQLKLIWVQDNNNSEEDDDFETWPNDIQDFDLVTFGLELEGKIQQSKTLIEQWCQILVHSSSMHSKCKSSTNLNTMHFVTSVCINVGDLLRYKADEILQFKKQIVILKDMVAILSNSFSRVRGCKDSKELLEYRDFVHSFSENAAWLVGMYWAKEANEENAIEMNVFLFDLLHKIIPFAAHVTASYFAVLKSNNLLQSDDSVSDEPALANFVDFFFRHAVLKDDFMILREWLIFLFTFLIDAPQENVEEEDVIRTQIYELKEDFSNKKMILSDFMNKIEILNASILQLYCGHSNSWNKLEVVKMNYIYFASLQRELSCLKHKKDQAQVQAQVHTYLMEIKFLRSFFQCFETWDDSDEETGKRLSSMVTSFQMIWGQEYDMGLLTDRVYGICKGASKDWGHLLELELKEKLQMSKQEINAWLVSLSHCSFHCRPSTSNKILKFLDSILYNMSDLVASGACKDVAFQKQIEILEEKLLLLKNFLKLATNCAYSKNLEEFNMLAQVFSNNAACVIYMYWAKEANDDIPAETNLILSNMLQKIKPDTLYVARTYIGTLKAICLQPYDSLLLEQTTVSFVDYFFEDLVTPWKTDFQILRDEVIFFLTFVHHHHTHNAEKIICSQLDVIFNDGVYDLLPFDDMKGDFSKKKIGLSDFMMNVGTENAKIRQLYCKFPDSFLSNFPKMIGQGFLDCLIQKLRNLMDRMISDHKYVSFAKYKIVTIEAELVSLTPIFIQIMELKDLNDAWLEVVNVVYLAEHVISLCFIFYHLIGQYIPYLSEVANRLKALKLKIENIEECSMYNARCLSHSAGFMRTHLEQDWTSEIPELVVGSELDEKIIIDNITRGTKSLDIVSIVGMGGLGKTTLAKKVFGSSTIKSHFHIFAFSYVSQHHNKRKVLVDILRDIDRVNDKSSLTEDDLAHKLKKCLSRKKYFIVLDDIWNINAWEEVRSSFPDDKNGSRVMFTTRSLEVAKKCQIQCSPHHLHFLSDDESWKLLHNKVFYDDMPPPNLFDVAKLIAKKCNGLPLAIVVIAGLLARTETSLWTEISKSVSSYLLDEGCMKILELSYKHLPEYLKPCLIYLGAFPKDSSYTVRHVMLLWIAEGFIKESKTKSLYDVANEYLYELVDMSLIIVDKMSIGEIHTFRVHDLIHDFCQQKCQGENFFQIGHITATSSFSAPSVDEHYRVSVQKLSDITADAEPSFANTRSLLYFPSELDYSERMFPLRKFRFAHVLYLKGIRLQESDFAHVTSMIDLRHIEVKVSGVESIPSSISNLWNMQSLIMRHEFNGIIHLPETLWRMKSLRHVEVRDCMLKVSDGYKLNAYPQLDKVISFSKPYLFSGKDVKWLLQRLPAVRRLNCILAHKSRYSNKIPLETLDFHSKLESLKLMLWGKGKMYPFLINFPSTLIKLILVKYVLSSTDIPAIAELQCLKILKLRDVSFPGPTWEMEDVIFPNLRYFELRRSNLVLWNANTDSFSCWNANTDSFPCLEQLFLDNTLLEELPPCFGEISSLKKITLWYSPKLESSARRVQEELMDLGNNVELEIKY